VSDGSGEIAVSVVPLGNGRYQVDAGGTRRIAHAVGSRDTWVFLDGHVFFVPLSPGPTAGTRPDDRALTAPMPATVLAIPVSPGQAVVRDEILIVLEAMKMELPVRAPRDGRVATINCRQGELVQAGATLLELEGLSG
jgi:acetyl/propionyl-CoA carboxylase alpha subunit